VSGLLRSQFGTKSWFASPHERDALLTEVIIGFTAPAISVVMPWRYLPALTFSAVFPLPKRSYDAPRRGVMSCQLGTSGIAAKLRAPTNCTGGSDCAGT
jgi:hypothetical protein